MVITGSRVRPPHWALCHTPGCSSEYLGCWLLHFSLPRALVRLIQFVHLPGIESIIFRSIFNFSYLFLDLDRPFYILTSQRRLTRPQCVMGMLEHYYPIPFSETIRRLTLYELDIKLRKYTNHLFSTLPNCGNISANGNRASSSQNITRLMG